MKKLILIVLLTQNYCFSQFKNYTISENKVVCEKMYSDISTLEIIEDYRISSSMTLTKADGLTSFLVGKVAKIPDYITQYLKKRKLKFTANYEAKNALIFASNKSSLPKLIFKRSFYNQVNKIATNAMELTLIPEMVQDEKFLVFKVGKLSFEYSKAKIKTKAPRINLLVEITAYYSKAKDNSTLEKTESKSSAIIIPVDLSVKDQITSNISNKLSDVFIADGISEISVKVTEINPYKLKLEELESFITDNNEDLSGLFSELSKLLK
ncbi:hypothetical protein [uncultured Algibacter sp.]|uniref:hypothetical protein n=1 Tax=uncultured Algibacter sp. TaxID=298659 RepID=UPI002621B81B|nr:hypothetical protein [uncultured Algibacter sp.]